MNTRYVSDMNGMTESRLSTNGTTCPLGRNICQCMVSVATSESGLAYALLVGQPESDLSP